MNQAAFAELDWRQIDVEAIVGQGGLATIDERRHHACRSWLSREGYVLHTFDCRQGVDVAIPELGRALRWEEQFGYALGPDSRNLDALSDGFEFDIREGGGLVFEIIRPDLAWAEDSRWLRGLLQIVREQCRAQLAVGRRFFGLLVLPAGSSFAGTVFDEIRVPGAYWDPCPEFNDFCPP